MTGVASSLLEPRTPQEVFDAAKEEAFASLGGEAAYSRYRDDPVAFGKEVLGESFTEDVERVMESVRDNPVTIAKSANSTGKTHGAARVAAWFYKSFEGAQVYTAAAPPERNLKQLLWGEIGAMVERSPDVFKRDHITTMHIARGPREFITGVTIPQTGTVEEREARFSGKHAPALLFIIDEGDAVPKEVYRGIESCMSGGFARLLIMFNPRAEQGAVFQMIDQGKANVVELSAFDHPNVRSGENVIPGAVDRETTVRRINEWTRPLAPNEKPDKECFEVPEFLVGARAQAKDGTMYPPLEGGWRKVTEPAFFYMVLAKYPPRGSQQLISRTWIDWARARWDAYVAEHGERPPAGTAPIMGLDVAEYGDDSNVASFRYGGYVPRLITWRGMDPDATSTRAAELYKERETEPQAAYVDGTGVGSGVAPGMRRQGCRKALGIKVAEKPTRTTEMGDFAQLRDQLYWAIREWLRDSEAAMLPPDEELIEELKTPTYGFDRRRRIKVMAKEDMKELLGRSPDKLDGLALTFAPHEPLKGGAMTSFRGDDPPDTEPETSAASPLTSFR